jgi:serine-type D-Ala-D-Ala carboxypeptidase/endopeptidase (penicillin-binding protein 4)
MYDAMKKLTLLFGLLLMLMVTAAQNITDELAKAVAALENDPQLQSATISFYVLDAESGSVVFNKNAFMGVAPASTQKVITSTAAYEILGKTFRYVTDLGYTGNVKNGILSGSLFIRGSGDPTFGSWRYKETGEEVILARILNAVTQAGIRQYARIQIDTTGWGQETTPGGWIWDDIGNYYGAGATVLNWHENQYDLMLHSGSQIGSGVSIVGTRPRLYNFPIASSVTAAEKGTGDNTIVYFKTNQQGAFVRGTIPVNESNFTVGGAMPSGIEQFRLTVEDYLAQHGVAKVKNVFPGGVPESPTAIYSFQSPVLDSIIYWFLKKSINLYGEALVKSLAARAGKPASTENGVEVVRHFWESKGVDETELHLVDGSGLSPLNRVTTHAQVKVLEYARKQDWFSGFYEALPVYNGMKMKSGSISGVKSFCGYQHAKDGHEYIFSMIVNNYNGSSAAIVQKMFKVLDVLKQ